MSTDFITLARHPDARMDFVRRSVYTNDGCALCGGYRMRAGTLVRALFQYGLWRGGAKPTFEKAPPTTVSGHRFDLLFCSKVCHDHYHGV